LILNFAMESKGGVFSLESSERNCLGVNAIHDELPCTCGAIAEWQILA
jgi:hypothetical protein